MALLPHVGRRSFRIRAVIVLMYVLLILGSITMVYPFLLMIAGSFAGADAHVDGNRMDLIPPVLTSERVQFVRFQEDRYDTYDFIAVLGSAYGEAFTSTSDATIPDIDEDRVRRYWQFLNDDIDGFPPHFYLVQEMNSAGKRFGRNFRRLKSMHRRECGPIEQFNRRYGMQLLSWNDYGMELDRPFVREFLHPDTPKRDKYLAFRASRPTSEKVVLNIDGLYWNTQRRFPEIKSGALDRARILHERRPAGDEAKLWTRFVRYRLNPMFIKLDATGLARFRASLASAFPGGITEMNAALATRYASFDDVHLTFQELRNAGMFTQYNQFIMDIWPVEHLSVDTPATRYRRHVGSDSAIPPFVASDYLFFKQARWSFVSECIARNYICVASYLLVHGRAAVNTLIYIAMSIIGALTVCPLAAYALSRFKLKATYSILTFFLATMAFPGIVTMIPNFLLLKELGFLNTYWALVLPGLVSGPSVFILKGFFDSIPRDVYDSAMIDGAGEWRLFWQFTMALSKPILALLALGAFTSAYTAFMFALVICPDEKMWTLMVWLFQLQMRLDQSMNYAALIISSVPTLLVFVLCQRVIIRGIVIPVEK